MDNFIILLPTINSLITNLVKNMKPNHSVTMFIDGHVISKKFGCSPKNRYLPACFNYPLVNMSMSNKSQIILMACKHKLHKLSVPKTRTLISATRVIVASIYEMDLDYAVAVSKKNTVL